MIQIICQVNVKQNLNLLDEPNVVSSDLSLFVSHLFCVLIKQLMCDISTVYLSAAMTVQCLSVCRQKRLCWIMHGTSQRQTVLPFELWTHWWRDANSLWLAWGKKEKKDRKNESHPELPLLYIHWMWWMSWTLDILETLCLVKTLWNLKGRNVQLSPHFIRHINISDLWVNSTFLRWHSRGCVHLSMHASGNYAKGGHGMLPFS